MFYLGAVYATLLAACNPPDNLDPVPPPGAEHAIEHAIRAEAAQAERDADTPDAERRTEIVRATADEAVIVRPAEPDDSHEDRARASDEAGAAALDVGDRIGERSGDDDSPWPMELTRPASLAQPPENFGPLELAVGEERSVCNVEITRDENALALALLPDARKQPSPENTHRLTLDPGASSGLRRIGEYRYRIQPADDGHIELALDRVVSDLPKTGRAPSLDFGGTSTLWLSTAAREVFEFGEGPRGARLELEARPSGNDTWSIHLHGSAGGTEQTIENVVRPDRVGHVAEPAPGWSFEVLDVALDGETTLANDQGAVKVPRGRMPTAHVQVRITHSTEKVETK